MDINHRVAQRIKELRKEKNLTAEKLAWYSELSKLREILKCLLLRLFVMVLA